MLVSLTLNEIVQNTLVICPKAYGGILYLCPMYHLSRHTIGKELRMKLSRGLHLSMTLRHYEPYYPLGDLLQLTHVQA